MTATTAFTRALAFSGGVFNVQGFRLSSTNVNGFHGIVAQISLVTIGHLQFGPCTGAHISSQNGGSILLLATPFIIETGATAGAHVFAGNGGFMTIIQSPLSPPSLVVNGAVSIANFVNALNRGEIDLEYSSMTGAGSVTGARYSVSGNAIIDSFGSGTTYFPGTVGGTAATGGQYF